MSAPDERPGLQAERTALSWSRTALAALALAGASLKAGLDHDDPLAYLTCGIATLTAVLLAGRARLTRMTSPSMRAIRLVAAGLLLAGVLAAASVVRQLLAT